MSDRLPRRGHPQSLLTPPPGRHPNGNEWGLRNSLSPRGLRTLAAQRHGVGIVSGDLHGLRQRSRKSRPDEQDADTLCRRRKSSCSSCESCQNHRSVRLASTLECLSFSVSPCLVCSQNPRQRFQCVLRFRGLASLRRRGRRQIDCAMASPGSTRRRPSRSRIVADLWIPARTVA